MAPTSEERREVAARLRARAVGLGFAYHDVHALNDGWVYRTLHEIVKAIGCAENQHPAEWMFMLADLIDPTCDAEQDYDRDEPIQGRWWKCDVCGEHFIYERGFAPRFCPECGARVLNE